jgi:hypothetical protein
VIPGGNVELKGPLRSISAADTCLIDLSLSDYDPTVFNKDDEIIKQQILWNVYDPFNKYDEAQQTIITGKYGRGLISYVVLRDAAEAVIEVVLHSGHDGKKPADVYGSITASNGIRDSEDRPFTSHLFKRSPNDKQHVDGIITLLRTSMAVPQNKELVIHVDLNDHDHEIANGSVAFKPLITQSANDHISGKHGNKIEVRITWY